MNWLAHAYLAPSSPAALLGNIGADFLNGPDIDHLPDEMRAGVMMHRRIDSFTDAHPLFKRSMSRIAGFRLLRGILVDIFYDHILAKNWSAWSPTPLDEFVAWVYATLREQDDILPKDLRGALPTMERENWLASYAEVDGIRYILERMSRHRLRRAPDLPLAADELVRNLDGLQEDFQAFFPALKAYASGLMDGADPYATDAEPRH
jgi:acyl carrier protein phosphodiesterase